MRNFQPFPSLSLFHVCTLYVPFSAALLFVLFSSFSSVRAPHLLSSSYFFLPLPNAHPLALAFFVAFYNRVQRCGASQFYRGRSIRASPSRSIVAMGNSPLRLQKCCLRDTRGRRGAARKRGRAGGGWEDCWNLGMGFTRGRGKAGRHGGATRRRGGEWREGGGVVRTLCQELSALGKNSIPQLKGMTRSSEEPSTAEAVIFARVFVQLYFPLPRSCLSLSVGQPAFAAFCVRRRKE